MRYNFKFLISLFVVLYIIMTVLVFNFYIGLALKDAKQGALYILDTTNSVRDYISNVQRPVINELKEKKLLNDDFFDPRLMSASYITKEIYNIQKNKRKVDYEYKLITSNVLNPMRRGNEFENKVLEGFKDKKYSEYSKIIFDSNNSLSYFVGLPVAGLQSSCFECHSTNSLPKQYTNLTNFDGKIGDTVAMISYTIPIKSIFTYHIKEFIISGLIIFIFFSLYIFFIYKMYINDKKLKQQTELLMINQNRLALMGEMIENISHQWKQPLAQISSILINVELYSQRDRLTKEKLNENIKETQKQVEYMSDTIDDFKNFFNPNTPKKEFTSQEAINQACKILGSSLRKYGVNLEIDIKNNFTHFGNINEIIQVIISIINNAKEAFLESQNRDKMIKITSFLQDDTRNISIENNAGNIDEKLLDTIFKPHFTTKKTGNGLGLYMSKMVMEKNKGQISVKNVNNSVIFTIIFF
ncbi:multi-sensor signal transduction histidine kinase [Campylobacter hyointestinalis subsp. hyointestinalis]|nr:DUF3365 domain-containing protein [Campylobacter hyointestinalis]CUU69775.1 multi-sensor signal transduction histidine kinase [Campylobacter hyointestinalis subsp. hyointestinalis]CUU74023.1 multi-sensor signal transduction histidine kinase [Campylobacter hyointestinalis subsp. hyointestinalis]